MKAFNQRLLLFFFLSKAVDKHGISALLAAIWEGHTECVKLLIESGADTQGTTPDGKSYIEVADKEEIKNLLK